eukprot:5679049-Amphidinium_carterae.1
MPVLQTVRQQKSTQTVHQHNADSSPAKCRQFASKVQTVHKQNADTSPAILSNEGHANSSPAKRRQFTSKTQT